MSESTNTTTALETSGVSTFQSEKDPGGGLRFGLQGFRKTTESAQSTVRNKDLSVSYLKQSPPPKISCVFLDTQSSMWSYEVPVSVYKPITSAEKWERLC